MDLKDKVILITGASDGLGKQLSLWCASKGLKVALVSKTQEKLDAIKQEINNSGGIAESFVCDVAHSEAVKECVQQIISKFGQIDILVNNAGIWIEGELTSNDEEAIHRVIEVNTLGTIYVTKNVLTHMKDRRSGLIINVISQAGLNSKGERSVYGASKWALTGFTKNLNVEVAQYGIRVTGFYPGLMNTDLFEKAGVQKNKTNALQVNQTLQAFEFILSVDENVNVPEVGMKNINN